MAAARGRDVLLRLRGDAGDAKRALADVRSDLRRMGREEATAKVDIQTARAERQLDGLRAKLARYAREKPSATVDLKTARAQEQIALIEFRLDRLRLKRVTVDVDVKRGALERTAAGIGFVERGVQGLGNGFANIFHQVPILGGLLESVLGGAFTLASNLGTALGGAVTRGLSSVTALASPIGSVVGSVASLGGSLLTLAAAGGALIIALNAIIGAIIALGGALVALVASAAAAAAGLGALAIAFGAALIPVAIVALGVFQRFQAIMKAHQAQTQALASATQDAKTAEQAHTQALDERKRAEEQLAQATVQGRQAATQAIRDETDAELGLRNAKNGVQDARLQLALAKRDLRELLTQAGATGPALKNLLSQATDVHADPSKLQGLLGGLSPAGGKKVDPLDLRQKIQAVRDAQLGVANATNQVTHAEDNLGQARKKETDFAKNGLKAYGPYRQALEAVARANQHVAKAAEQSSAAARKRDAALKGLTGTEKGTLSRLDALIAGFTRLSKAFTDPVFRALNQVFDDLSGHAGDFTGVLTKVGEAFADVIRAIGSFLTQPRTLTAFKVMANGAADLVRQLGARAFVSFLTIMREIAVTALPAVRAAARSVAGWLERIAGQPGRIHSAVKTLVDQFRTWTRLAGSLVGLVKDIFTAAAPAGKSLAESLRHIVDRWREWIRANPQKVRQFFRDAVQKTKDIVGGIRNMVAWLRDHLPSAATKAKTVFNGIYQIVKKIIDIVDRIQKASGDIATAVGLGGKDFGDKAKTFAADMKAAAQDALLLKKHLTPEQRDQTRTRLSDTLQEAQGLGVRKLPPGLQALLKRLQNLGFASGGVVPGSGRGDIVPAMLEPGEFVLRRAVVSQLSLPVLHALNGGAVPVASAVQGGGDVHNYHVSVPGGGAPDPRSFIESVHRIVQTKG